MKHDEQGAPLAPPPAAEAVFAERLSLAEQYVRHLASTGVSHGLIGPREVPRLWERHVLNCAVLTELLPDGARVADIGSGAGLPGLCLAIRRPDLQVVLVEPLMRRVSWLDMVVQDLRLADRVTICRGRAPDVAQEVRVPFVTGRAVATLRTLAGWGLPLLDPGGALLAIKGRTAQGELDATAAWLHQAGATGCLVTLGADRLQDPTLVVRIDRGPGPLPRALRPRDSARRPHRARRPAELRRRGG